MWLSNQPYNLGVSKGDSILSRRAKQLYFFDILMGIFLPLLSEIILRFFGYADWPTTVLNLSISLSFAPYLFLLWKKKFTFSVIVYQITTFLVIIAAAFTAKIFLTSLFFLAPALNAFIYFPEKKKLATGFFLFFVSATLVSFTGEFFSLDLNMINLAWMMKLKNIVFIFMILFAYKVFSLILIYWTSIRDVERSRDALAKSDKRFRSLFENGFDGICVIDMNISKIISFNQRLATTFGASPEMIKKSFPDAFLPETQPNGMISQLLKEKLREELRSKKNINKEWVMKKASGDLIYIEFNLVILPAPDDNLFICIIRDVTDQQEQKQQIQNQMQELHQKNVALQKYIESNLELENFAHIASHDLKAPIRTIGSFSKLLKKRAAAKLDESELEFLDFIHQGAQNMQNLVEDLLAYSKVKNDNNRLDLINLPLLIELVQRDLHSSIEKTKAVINCSGLPKTIYADPTKIRQLFQNLITNALKFTKKGEIPRIEIRGNETATHWHFSVEDNGIGIAPEYHEKIFMIFRKLHAAGDYEGSGIGLSICKKVVEQHFGTIALESKVGEFTRFDFSLQKGMDEQEAKTSGQRYSSISES